MFDTMKAQRELACRTGFLITPRAIEALAAGSDDPEVVLSRAVGAITAMLRVGDGFSQTCTEGILMYVSTRPFPHIRGSGEDTPSPTDYAQVFESLRSEGKQETAAAPTTAPASYMAESREQREKRQFRNSIDDLRKQIDAFYTHPHNRGAARPLTPQQVYRLLEIAGDLVITG